MFSKKIKVCSFDFDGCISGVLDYTRKMTEICSQVSKDLDLLKRHHEYVNTWEKHIQTNYNKKDTKTIVLSGSTRQDHQINELNIQNRIKEKIMWKNTKYDGMVPTREDMDSFLQFPNVVTKMNENECDAEFIPLLFPDFGYKAGKTFNNPLWTVSSQHLMLDEKKANLLTFQVNWLHENYPNYTIEMSFYDDRLDILQEIKKKVVPKLPKNISLRLFRMDWFGYVSEKKGLPIEEIK